MRIDSTHDKLVTRPNTEYSGSKHMSQEQEDKEVLDDHLERIRRIIDEDREILDELA